MKTLGAAPRASALALVLSLGLPSPALALRVQSSKQSSGLEELHQALAGLEEGLEKRLERLLVQLHEAWEGRYWNEMEQLLKGVPPIPDPNRTPSLRELAVNVDGYRVLARIGTHTPEHRMNPEDLQAFQGALPMLPPLLEKGSPIDPELRVVIQRSLLDVIWGLSRAGFLTEDQAREYLFDPRLSLPSGPVWLTMIGSALDPLLRVNWEVASIDDGDVRGFLIQGFSSFALALASLQDSKNWIAPSAEFSWFLDFSRILLHIFAREVGEGFLLPPSDLPTPLEWMSILSRTAGEMGSLPWRLEKAAQLQEPMALAQLAKEGAKGLARMAQELRLPSTAEELRRWGEDLPPQSATGLEEPSNEEIERSLQVLEREYDPTRPLDWYMEAGKFREWLQQGIPRALTESQMERMVEALVDSLLVEGGQGWHTPPATDALVSFGRMAPPGAARQLLALRVLVVFLQHGKPVSFVDRLFAELADLGFYPEPVYRKAMDRYFREGFGLFPPEGEMGLWAPKGLDQLFESLLMPTVSVQFLPDAASALALSQPFSLQEMPVRNLGDLLAYLVTAKAPFDIAVEPSFELWHGLRDGRFILEMNGTPVAPDQLFNLFSDKATVTIRSDPAAGLEEDSEGALEPLAVRIRYIRDKQELVRVASIEDSTERLGAEKWNLEDFLRHRPSRDTSILVAEHEKRIVGFLVYQWVYSEEDETGPAELELKEIRILNLGAHPDFQGRAVERQLVEWLILKLRRQYPLVSFSFTNHVLDEQAREPFLNLGFKAKPIPDHFGEGEDAYELFLRPTASEAAHPNAIQLAAEWEWLQRFGGERQIRNILMPPFLDTNSVQMQARYVAGFLAEISHRRQILERRNREVVPSAILRAPEIRDFLRLITQSPPVVRKMVWTLRWMGRDPSLAPVVSQLKETLTWLTEAASHSRSRTVEPASKNLNLLLEAVTGTGVQGQVGPPIPPGQPPSAPEGQTESAGLEEKERQIADRESPIVPDDKRYATSDTLPPAAGLEEHWLDGLSPQERLALVHYGEKIGAFGGDVERFWKYLAQPRRLPYDLDGFLNHTPSQKEVIKSLKPLQYAAGFLYHGGKLDGLLRSGRLEGEVPLSRLGYEYAIGVFRRRDVSDPAIYVIRTDLFNRSLQQGKATLAFNQDGRLFGSAVVNPTIRDVEAQEIHEIWLLEDSYRRHRTLLETLFRPDRIKVIPGVELGPSDDEVLHHRVFWAFLHYVLNQDLLKEIPAYEVRPAAGLEEKIPLAPAVTASKVVFITPEMASPALFGSLKIFKPAPGKQLRLVVFAGHAFHAEEIEGWLNQAGLAAREVVNVQREIGQRITEHPDWNLFDVVAAKQAEYYLGTGADIHTIWFFEDLKNLGRFLGIAPIHVQLWEKSLERQYGTQA